ncbi:tail assembly chaperone [Staphylococcus sp. LKG3-1]|uniref:tail assembly chaperone n=1 Tax=unclassified Staphylococcus TaxID=91994 RepID=UPI0029781FE6|nr:tail assembly chaperone [Staphylococcus saprophyticus]MDW4034564.1 tail assembly chaperone [Staphylococcus saprophyticus]
MAKQTKETGITVLNINGEDYKARGSFYFDQKAEKYATEDKEGNVVDGFSNIYQDLLNRKTKALYQFWDCALAYKQKGPSFEDIMVKIDEVIDEKGTTIELIQGALSVLSNSGFFKEQTGQFWKQMNAGKKMAKEEDKETVQEGIEFMKENYKDIMGEEPYLTTAK